MKRFIFLLAFLYTFCLSAYSQATGLTDLKFGKYQVADSQWNVSACMYSATCQIYSKQPGTAYKIPWTSGQIVWATGDYISFQKTGNNTNPWNAIQYSSSGVQKAVMGAGHIINMGTDYFFFVGSDNNTGQLFSMTSGFANTSGVTWTGTLNPSVAQVDAYATNGSMTPLAAGQTVTPTGPPPPPPLCCGAVTTPFNASTTNVTKVASFQNRTTADSQVYIEQLGNQNLILVEQTGTKNNYVKYSGNGSSNTIKVNQKSSNNSQTNYADVTVNGNYNSVDIKQKNLTETNSYGKGAFVNISDNNNSLLIDQKNGGSHYASVLLSGGNKNVDITQQGSASHMANVTLTGMPVDLSLTQSGSTQNYYSINFNCATAGGCQKITVQQGQ